MSTFGAIGSAFGTSSAPATQAQTTLTINNGTGNPVWCATIEQDNAQRSSFECISAMAAYKNWSMEELRFQDYVMGRKGQNGAAVPSGTGFGFGGSSNTTAPAPFGQSMQSNPFGTPQPVSNPFGVQSTPAFNNTGFPQQQTGSNIFDSKPSSGGFGLTPTTNIGFGNSQTNQPAKPSFGTFGTTGTFGQPTAPSFSGSGFGTQAPASNAFGGGSFGQPAATVAAPFSQPPATGLFGNNPTHFGQPIDASKPTFGFGNAGIV